MIDLIIIVAWVGLMIFSGYVSKRVKTTRKEIETIQEENASLALKYNTEILVMRELLKPFLKTADTLRISAYRADLNTLLTNDDFKRVHDFFYKKPSGSSVGQSAILIRWKSVVQFHLAGPNG